jgi:hypothetical protein
MVRELHLSGQAQRFLWENYHSKKIENSWADRRNRNDGGRDESSEL